MSLSDDFLDEVYIVKIQGDGYYSKDALSQKFKLNQVIQGWQEVLQLMPIGSKWKATIPSDLAYGERGAGSTIGPNSTLLFDIELLDIK